MSFDLAESKREEGKVTGLYERTSDILIEINNLINVTPEHLIFVNGELERAEEIEIGDILTNSENENIAVRSLRKYFGKFKVYNLEVENTHTYYAEELLVHNFCWGDFVAGDLRGPEKYLNVFDARGTPQKVDFGGRIGKKPTLMFKQNRKTFWIVENPHGFREMTQEQFLEVPTNSLDYFYGRHVKGFQPAGGTPVTTLISEETFDSVAERALKKVASGEDGVKVSNHPLQYKISLGRYKDIAGDDKNFEVFYDVKTLSTGNIRLITHIGISNP